MRGLKSLLALFIALAVSSAVPIQACDMWVVTCGDMGGTCTSLVALTGEGQVTRLYSYLVGRGGPSPCFAVDGAEFIHYEITWVDCNGSQHYEWSEANC